MSVMEHKSEKLQVNVMVITISDTRTTSNDKSGQKMVALLEQSGHRIVAYKIVKDEPAFIEQAVRNGCENAQVQAVLLNGGTGIAERDVTFEVLQGLIEKPIPGFGELFRLLSFEQIGTAAMLSRATAGIAGRTVIFSTPGSINAVTLAMKKLILPELSHIIRELNK
jgi:molybdopterin adenylyltransferase